MKEANSKFGPKGFTLIELIIFIVIAGIFLPATYVAFSASMRNATQPEDWTRERLLAEGVMELATSKGYDKLKQHENDPDPCNKVIEPEEPLELTCTYTLSYLSVNTDDGLKLTETETETNYIQIVFEITTPQGNKFKSTGTVTK